MPALERDEARHSIALAMLAAIANGQASNVVTWSLGSPGQCAIMLPGRPILLTDLDHAQCRSLAEATVRLDYPGVVGPEWTAHWFARHATNCGIKFLEPIPQRIHSLTAKPSYPGVPGHARHTTAADAGVVADWITSFSREATPHDVVPPRERTRSRCCAGPLYVVDRRRDTSVYGGHCPPDTKCRRHRGRLHATAFAWTRLCRISDRRGRGAGFCRR